MTFKPEEFQQLLFPYAYNILGSAEDAKDVVQQVISNVLFGKNEHILNLKSYLIKSVINRSINLKNKLLQSHYEGKWLPEPISDDYSDAEINSTETLSYSLLILLEKLNPKERAVFILKEAYDYSHKEISEVISTSIENSRKILSRAKSQLKSKPEKTIPLNQNNQNEYLTQFMSVIKNRNIKELETFLNNQIKVTSDGGGKVSTIRNIVSGKERVIKLLLGLYHKYYTDLKFKFSDVNHQPAVLFQINGSIFSCMIFEIEEDEISNISFVLNPDKLKYLK